MLSYPQGVSLQGPHHGQEERLLEQSEESADQGLHASQAAELRGWVPAQGEQHVTDINNACELVLTQIQISGKNSNNRLNGLINLTKKPLEQLLTECQRTRAFKVYNTAIHRAAIQR